MAVTNACRNVTRIAGEALTIYRAVRSSAGGLMTHTDVTAAQPVGGICQEDGIASGDNFPMAIPDGADCKIEAGGAIPAGSDVTTNASGQAIVAATGNAIIGSLVGTVAAASGDIITIQFAHKGAQD